MRKSIFAIMGILLIFAAVACTQNPVGLPDQKPGGEGELGTWDINNTEDLQRFFSMDGTATARMNLTVDPSSNMFPMTIVGNKTFSGDIRVGGASGASYASNITPPQSRAEGVAEGAKQLFVVANGASVTLTNLDVTVSEEAAAQISAVVAVNNSTISTDNYNVTVSGSSTGTVTGIAIGANTAAENITISNSKPGNIYISPDNEADSDIQKEIIADNPDIVVETKYNAATKEEFNANLTSYGKVIITTDELTLDELPISVGGIYEIDLNGKSVSLKAKSTTVIPQGATLTISNGSLNVDMTNPSDGILTWGLALDSGSTLTLNNVDMTAAEAGIGFLIGSSNTHLNVINDSSIEGYTYGIGTNASPDPALTQNANIKISDSSVSATGAGILFNIPGVMIIDNSDIYGEPQAIVARGGSTTLINSRLHGKYDGSGTDYSNKDWGQGNNVPFAVLVIGNRADGYKYSTDVTVDGSFDIDMDYTGTEPATNKYYDIYIAASNGPDCSVTITDLPDNYANAIKTNGAYWIRDLVNDVLTLNGEKLTANPE